MKIHVPRANASNPTLAHENGRVRVVNEVSRQVRKLPDDLPGIMSQGRLDLAAPLVTAWELKRVWKNGDLVVVSEAGHSWTDPGMTGVLVAGNRRTRC